MTNLPSFPEGEELHGVQGSCGGCSFLTLVFGSSGHLEKMPTEQKASPCLHSRGVPIWYTGLPIMVDNQEQR